MYSHEQIWRGIDRLANSAGYSPSGLAKKAGLDPTSFNKSKRVSPDGKPRWPSTESLSKILAATGATMSDFMSFIGAEDEIHHKPKTLKIIGFAQAGKNGYFDADGYPAGDGWDEFPFPESSTKSGVAKNKTSDDFFALQVSGDSMEPLLRAGDVVVLSASAKIRKGDRIVVRTSKGEVLAKELLRQNQNQVVLKSLNPAYEDRTLPQAHITWMAKICWIGQ